MMKAMNAASLWKATVALVLGAMAAMQGTPALAAPPGSPWGANYFPNTTLVNQDGKKLKFYDDMLKGKVVMINFMYSACHDACPLETAKLRQVQEELGARVGKDIFMYSISIDPTNDTPATLKEYAAKYKVAPGWQFLTGKAEEITKLRKKLGLWEQPEQPNDHGMDMIVGNEATGVWKRRSTFDNPKVLARAVGDDLFNYARSQVSAASYANSPVAISIDPGEDLFRRRCQVCHTIGSGDTLGPDLKGVTNARSAAWLKRWIQEPDKVLAEKDPIATALFAKYNKMIMPNLKLADHDVENLLDYIKAASVGADKPKQAMAHDAGGHDAAAHDAHSHHHH